MALFTAKYQKYTEDLPNERWADIQGYEGLYKISDCGRVMSLPKIYGRMYRDYSIILKSHAHLGYLRVRLSNSVGKVNNLSIHRLVAKSFVHNPDPQNKRCINHKDFNRQNNSPSNLEWVTQWENMLYSGERNPAMKKGLNSIHCKLTKDEILRIKELLSDGMKNIEIANMFSVSDVTISQIKTDHRWADIK